MSDHNELIDNWDPRDSRLAYPREIYRDLRDREVPPRSSFYDGFTVFGRYDDVTEIAGDYETFSSAKGISMPPYGNPRPMMPLELDPPEQGDFRRALSRRLSVKAVRTTEDRIRREARRLLEPLAAGQDFEFVREFAHPYPVLAFWQEPYMGPPVETPRTGANWLDSFIQWSYDMHHDDEKSGDGVAAMFEYIDAVLDDRTANPRDDIPTQLLNEELAGKRLSREELYDTLLLFFSAGIETTQSAVGNFVHYLGRNPDVRDALVADPSKIEPAVEELLRLVGPNQGVRRTATKDAEVRGCPVGKDEAVLIMWAAANLDERQFECPDEFRFDRGINPHMAFGKGVHRCLGVHLARMELRIAIEELLRVAPQFEIAEEEAELEWKLGIDRALRRLTLRRGDVSGVTVDAEATR